MEQRLKNLLDKIYELEGLVELALKREDSRQEFYRLISKKGTEIGEICGTLQINESAKSNDTDYSLEEYYIDEESDKEGEPDKLDKREDDSELNSISGMMEDELDSSKETISRKDSVNEKGKLVFSINEKFRFRKELFDNSDIDFNNTLALVASMETFEEAEDYFLNEEEFDPKNPIVIEFMNVIKRYFR